MTEAVQAPGGVEIQAEYPVCMAGPGGTTGLACDPIAQSLEGFGEIGARQVPGELHAEMTSSRTKWSRMTLGA